MYIPRVDSHPQFTLGTSPEIKNRVLGTSPEIKIEFWGRPQKSKIECWVRPQKSKIDFILSFWGQQLCCPWCSFLDSGDIPRTLILAAMTLSSCFRVFVCASHFFLLVSFKFLIVVKSLDGGSRQFKGCLKFKISRKFKGCFKEFQRCFKEVSRKFQGDFQERFKDDPNKIEGCFKF